MESDNLSEVDEKGLTPEQAAWVKGKLLELIRTQAALAHCLSALVFSDTGTPHPVDLHAALAYYEESVVQSLFLDE